MENFTFQQETNGGWVVGKRVSGDAILFGPTLADVVDQASKADRFLAEFRRDHARNHPVAMQTGPCWLDLQVA